MRIGVIIITVRAHDARTAAPRLTLPVPDGRCPARILAGHRPPGRG
jgi:hypothetical protein